MKKEIILTTISTEENLVYHITQDGVFPAIPITVDIDNLQSGDKLVRVWSEQQITFKENNRNDSLKAVVELKKQAAKQEVPVVLNDVQGGKLEIVCKANIDPRVGDNMVITSKTSVFKILGTQPNKEQVHSALNLPYLSAVVYLKSQFMQFTKDGTPTFDKGWGMYRIENPSAIQIWSWKENIASAKFDFEIRKKRVSEYPAQLRASNPELYKKLPDFTEKQIELEALQSYGSGLYYIPKQATITRKWVWVRNPKDDGYADKCLAILANVSQGKFPEGWN